jgi:hypothetical protein
MIHFFAIILENFARLLSLGEKRDSEGIGEGVGRRRGMDQKEDVSVGGVGCGTRLRVEERELQGKR